MKSSEIISSWLKRSLVCITSEWKKHSCQGNVKSSPARLSNDENLNVCAYEYNVNYSQRQYSKSALLMNKYTSCIAGGHKISPLASFSGPVSF